MEYTHTIDQANDIACRALERIHKEQLPPSPQIFSLWYSYLAKSNSNVVSALDFLIHKSEPIVLEQCLEIYDKYLAESSNNSFLQKAEGAIQDTILEIIKMLESSKSVTTEYSGSLNKVKDRLTKSDNIDVSEFKDIVHKLVQDTKQIAQKNEALESELNKSSQAMRSLQEDMESIRKEAITDGLTGLANRKAFDNELIHTASESEADNVAFSLIMLDIDHFKSFNDNFGHQVGDQVLKLVARTLIDGIKGLDFAARYGGEEFAIILPKTNVQAAAHVANALRQSVASKELVNRSSGHKLGRVTVSAGISEYIAGEDPAKLIERADSALYTAKHNGRNQVASAPIPSS